LEQADSIPHLDCTVVIFAHNAASRVITLIEGLRGLVNEVVVCDIGSTDGTASSAREAGARVIERDRVPVVEMLRQEVIDSIDASWLLILDDDEVPERRLLRSLAAVIDADRADLVAVSRVTYFFGDVLRHAGYQPTNIYQAEIRLFKQGMLRAPTRVHQRFEHVSGARYLRFVPEDGSLHHFSYDSVSQWLEKVDRYTDAEAQWLVANVVGRRWPTLKFAARVITEPVSLIIRHRALSGGWRGRVMVVFMLNYRITSWAKARELADGYGEHAARAKYQRLAAELLSQSTPDGN